MCQSATTKCKRAEKRYQDFKHIERKKRIIRNTYSTVALDDERCIRRLFNHRLSHNKVHRSDAILSHKTKNNGLKHSELKRYYIGYN